mgnify:FL=1
MIKKTKYEQHIRLATKIFNDRDFLKIPKRDRLGCLGALIVLLRFADGRTRKSYPRLQTIANLLGCGKNKARKSLLWLKKVGIISIKRLQSTNLYQIHPFFYVGDSEVSKQVYQKFQRGTSEVSNQVGINKTIFNISKTNPAIDKIIKKYGHDKETLIDQLATLPLPDLQSEYNNNLNKYYMKLAIEKKNGG